MAQILCRVLVHGMAITPQALGLRRILREHMRGTPLEGRGLLRVRAED